MKSLEWFKQRIGKRIYRDDSGCSCSTCRDVAINGLVITDENHAEYLYDNQNDFAIDGLMLNYRDTL